MTNQQAIQKSIQGGYKHPHSVQTQYKVFLDTSFWRALGTAMNWKKLEPDWDMGNVYKEDSRTWLDYWFRFIDHTMEGKSIKDFVKEL